MVGQDMVRAGALNARQDFENHALFVEPAVLRRRFHHRQRPDQIGVEPQLDPGNVEVLETADRLDSVVRVGGNIELTERIALTSLSATKSRFSRPR